jgi:hypothetical protein
MSSRKKKRESETQIAEPAVASAAPVIGFVTSWSEAFNQFWFTPRNPNVLGLIRLLTGLIAFYSIAVWTLELSAFFAADGMLPAEYRAALGGWAAWSHLDWFATSSTGLMVVHVVGLVIVAMFAAGFQTRVTSVLTALLVISYGNRSIGAGFGLDQIVSFLCLSCAIGESGGTFSVDRWLANSKDRVVAAASTSTNIAIRLIQIHMCIVYFFAAIGKLQGETWWTGEAVWLAMASYEYQQVEMTWLANYLPLVSAMTLVSLFWELFYSALIWPKLTRPIMLAMAVPLHLGIGLCMGMMEFGLIMLVGNLAFVSWWGSGDSCQTKTLDS